MYLPLVESCTALIKLTQWKFIGYIGNVWVNQYVPFHLGLIMPSISLSFCSAIYDYEFSATVAMLICYFFHFSNSRMLKDCGDALRFTPSRVPARTRTWTRGQPTFPSATSSFPRIHISQSWKIVCQGFGL